MSDITVTPEAYGTLCICAVRYALGRQTYMPEDVADPCLQGCRLNTSRSVWSSFGNARDASISVKNKFTRQKWRRQGNE